MNNKDVNSGIYPDFLKRPWYMSKAAWLKKVKEKTKDKLMIQQSFFPDGYVRS